MSTDHAPPSWRRVTPNTEQVDEAWYLLAFRKANWQAMRSTWVVEKVQVNHVYDGDGKLEEIFLKKEDGDEYEDSLFTDADYYIQLENF